jgi:cytochrome P450 PksS
MFSDPFPRYAELRRTAPVSLARHRETRRMTVYMLTRHRDVLTLHTDPRFSSDALKHSSTGRLMRFAPRVFRLLTDSMVFKDDPDHKRLRGLVNKAFTPRAVERMSVDIEKIASDLVDRLAAKGTVDLVADFAVPLPLAVISAMMGVGPAERDEFHAMVASFAQSSSGSSLDIVRAMPTARRMVGMFQRLAAEKRREPDDSLISAIVQAREGDDQLSDNEVVAMIFLLLLAGHDTTSNLIGNSILALMDNRDQLTRLREDPAIAEAAVEELLRFTAPVPCGVTRTMLADISIDGTTIPKGAAVIGMIVSANRDEEVFTDPDVLDLGRDPNRHISFAFGSHFCLGNRLARLEGRLALTALVQRFGRIELAVPRSHLEWKPTESLRGLKYLPLLLR